MRSARLGNLAAAAAVLIAGCDSARPIEQRSEVSACGRCHGFPPPPGVLSEAAGHPRNTACEVCHSATVVSGTQLVPGGAHLNGLSGDIAPHPMPYVAAHRAAALKGVTDCALCHGADFNGGTGPSCNACHGSIGFADWRTNCSFCHGTRTLGWTPSQPALAAPPEAAEDGVVDTADRRVGAHEQHLVAGTFANPVACTECHPARTDLAHNDQAVQLEFGPFASNGTTPSFDPGATTCANYCHGATLPFPETRAAPVWAPPSTLDCGSCHEANPTTGRHPGAVGSQHSFDCRTCHGGTYTPTAADRTLHVSGTVDKSSFIGWDAASRTCTSICHAPRAW
jgi:predicted CxxxxCH...CXXCH cytochrome family protein